MSIRLTLVAGKKVVGKKPPLKETKSENVVSSLSSKIALRLTSPPIPTVLPTGGTKITSPGNTRTSSLVSPRSNRSYKSKVETSLPLRFSSILRSEPVFLIPPLTNNALVIVDNELTVYEPGRLASPRIKIRTERSSPKVVSTLKPIARCLTSSFIMALSS